MYTEGWFTKVDHIPKRVCGVSDGFANCFAYFCKVSIVWFISCRISPCVGDVVDVFTACWCCCASFGRPVTFFVPLRCSLRKEFSSACSSLIFSCWASFLGSMLVELTLDCRLLLLLDTLRFVLLLLLLNHGFLVWFGWFCVILVLLVCFWLRLFLQSAPRHN